MFQYRKPSSRHRNLVQPSGGRCHWRFIDFTNRGRALLWGIYDQTVLIAAPQQTVSQPQHGRCSDRHDCRPLSLAVLTRHHWTTVKSLSSAEAVFQAPLAKRGGFHNRNPAGQLLRVPGILESICCFMPGMTPELGFGDTEPAAWPLLGLLDRLALPRRASKCSSPTSELLDWSPSSPHACNDDVRARTATLAAAWPRCSPGIITVRRKEAGCYISSDTCALLLHGCTDCSMTSLLYRRRG